MIFDSKDTTLSISRVPWTAGCCFLSYYFIISKTNDLRQDNGLLLVKKSVPIYASEKEKVELVSFRTLSPKRKKIIIVTKKMEYVLYIVYTVYN